MSDPLSVAGTATLITIFYSLNEILPKIDQTRCAEATTIRRCLKDSEGKLLELQQLLIQLRGPQQSTTNRDKMRETGRTLVYPFRVDALKSLRQSLRELLDNLNLAIDVTSLQSRVTNGEKIDTISLTIQDLDIQSKDTNLGVGDLNNKMQENLSQLRSLESTIADSLTETNQRISQAQWAIQDVGSNISGKLTITETEVVSNRRVMLKMFAEMAEKLDSQSAEISQLGIKISSIHDQETVFLDDPLKPVTRHPPRIGSPNRLISPMCDCKRRSRPSGFSLAFWNLKFEFQQEVPGKHRRTCKFFGIDGQTRRRVNAQFRLKLAWSSARMTLACMEYTMGTSSPGCSVRFKNIVPQQSSPVLRALIETGKSILASRSASETIQLLEGTERQILSLYREGQASPGDIDENGRCHMRMFIEIFANIDFFWVQILGFSFPATEVQERVWRDKSVLAVVLRILQVLNTLVQADNIRL
ncbi:hypothetical protein NCS52_01234000 [Fusarium sp. LHS14.1]|nr:hypothetical protein NCS52_01234000 [Fusarium sp. LHS14.1]